MLHISDDSDERKMEGIRISVRLMYVEVYISLYLEEN